MENIIKDMARKDSSIKEVIIAAKRATREVMVTVNIMVTRVHMEREEDTKEDMVPNIVMAVVMEVVMEAVMVVIINSYSVKVVMQ